MPAAAADLDRARDDTGAAFEELSALRAEGWRRNPAPPLTRARLDAALEPLGITRVGDLTGLDALGIPVWFAARPASRSLCVANGKGLTDADAWLTAVMEGAEQAIAENAPALVRLIDSPSGLARRGLKSVPLDRQSRCAARWLSPDQELAWVRGLSWRTGEEIYAPYELVGMDMAPSAPWNFRQFRMSSLGLAAGGDLAAAVRHGLRELVEDDAIFGPLMGGATGGGAPTIAFDPARAGRLSEVIVALAAKGIEARFVRAETGIRAPTVIAALKPTEGAGAAQTYYCGSACRDTVEEAALSALHEAVQSRLIFISGNRDDLGADEYGRRLRPGTEALFGGYRFAAGEGAGEGDSLAGLADRVLADGVGDIYVFPLGGQRHGLHVVRVLADDLVSCHAVPGYPHGSRAAAKLLRRWAAA